MPTSTVTSKGQITLPKEVRERLHLVEGDRVEFLMERDGRVHLLPVSSSVRDLYGCLQRKDINAPTLEELDEALVESLAAEDERIRRGGR
jgi:AbrB family looped-hinge helix DNA binding protein